MNARHRRRFYVALGATLSLQVGALVGACASDGELDGVAPEDKGSPIPAPTIDAGGDVDAGCTGDDCKYYPAECTEDALCSGGLFDPSNPQNGFDLRTSVLAFAARSPSDAWIGGSVGQLGHFDGTAWKPSTLGIQRSLAAIWLYGDAEVAFDLPSQLYTRGLDAGADAAVFLDGWSSFGSATFTQRWPTGATVATAWAHPDASTLWVGGAEAPSLAETLLWRLRRSETGAFTFSPLLNGDALHLRNREIFRIHGSSPNELWVVGSIGIAARVSEAESETPSVTLYNTLTTVALNGVWQAAPNDVWTVGATGTVRRYRGDPRCWEIYEDVPTKQHLRAIAGSSPNDIWIVGDEATVFHFDGTTWQRVKIAGLGLRRPRLEHVWVPSPGKVWIAGRGVLVSLGGKP